MTGKLWGSPWNTRVIALDIETCVAPDRTHRIVALGAVVCRAGGLRQRYSWLVNPGIPIDPITTTIHGITDADVAAEPSFADVLPEFSRLLVAKAGERIVLAAHNARFDIAWLRDEATRAGGQLPDLPIIDTAGSLPRLAGVRPAGRGLDDLLTVLSLTNPAPHDALGDAQAAGLALCSLFALVEQAGHDNLDALLTVLAGGTVAGTTAPVARSKVVQLAAPVPHSHIATHAIAMSAKPGKRELAKWASWISECAELRCEDLAARAAVVPPARLRELLYRELERRATANDAAGAATVLGALMPLLAAVPNSIAGARAEGVPVSRVPGQVGVRGTAIAIYRWIETTVAPLRRCGDRDACPACRGGQACPRDVWPQGLVPNVLTPDQNSLIALWNPRFAMNPATTKKPSGRGYQFLAQWARPLADACLRAALTHWRELGQSSAVVSIADQAWRLGGCRDPVITEVRAVAVARGGRRADLRAALLIAKSVLRHRRGNTDPAWEQLALRAAQIEGRLAQLETSGQQRHRAIKPARPAREPRFLRALA
jgi:DNA polymerase III epsilon subunit-like protein